MPVFSFAGPWVLKHYVGKGVDVKSCDKDIPGIAPTIDLCEAHDLALIFDSLHEWLHHLKQNYSCYPKIIHVLQEVLYHQLAIYYGSTPFARIKVIDMSMAGEYLP